MLLRSRNWLSSAIKRDSEIKDALDELSRLIRDYEDAAKPSRCRGPARRFFSAEIDLFRPNSILFVVVSAVCGVAGVVFGATYPEFNAAPWADALLRTAVTVFVVGVSLVNLTRSISESGRFAGEYLYESCRMKAFCCMTLLAALIALVARSLIAVTPAPLSVGLCGAAVGAAAYSLAMLAFVMLETIRCSLPGKAVEVVSKYAARRLCHAYLREAYVRLFMTQHKHQLEEWCTANCKAIHPPSRYYRHYFESHHGEVDPGNDWEIKLRGRRSGEDLYRDYCLHRVAELDTYLAERGAELYLSSHNSGRKSSLLGILASAKAPPDDSIRTEVEKVSERAVRPRKLPFKVEADDFWDSQGNALNEAIERAIRRSDPVELRAYLGAVNEPFSVLGQIKQREIVRDAYGGFDRRGYDFLRLYPAALHEILARNDRQAEHQTRLAQALLRCVWDEAQELCRARDCDTMKVFTWAVELMYRAICDEGDTGGALLQMRAQFGGFYKYAGAWLDDLGSEDAQGVEQMRLVLYEGLTKWLLAVLERPEEAELVKQLCDAAREIVFGDQGVSFERGELVAQHFVLAGHLMCQPEASSVKAGAVQRLFSDEYADEPHVDFKDLVEFYLKYPFPPQALNDYLRLFFTADHVSTDMLTGSSSSSGGGSTGVHEMALAFIYLGASALADSMDTPEPIAKDLSYELREEVIRIVAELFEDGRLHYGLEQLKTWRDECTELHDAEEARKIVETPFDQGKIEEWRRKFWEAYCRSSPVLSLCIENGNYQIDETALVELLYHLPKMAVIEWKHPIGGAGGDNYGRSLGRSRERDLLWNMTKTQSAASRTHGGLAEAVRQAAGWLKAQTCRAENAVIVVASKHRIASELYREESFIPPWREDVRAKGFDGFYDGYPLVWLRKQDDGEGDEKQERAGDQVVAVDLRGWKAIKVRKSVVTKQEFGELDIRTWTQAEIAKAVESEKLKAEDVDKAKGNCPVDVSLYWEFATDDLPPVRAFEVHPPDDRPAHRGSPEPATDSPDD